MKCASLDLSRADSTTPESSQDSVTTDSETFTTLWFVGLQIRPNVEGAVDLDLTEPIQEFTDRGSVLDWGVFDKAIFLIMLETLLVYQQAHKAGIVEPLLDAKYVRR